MAYVNQHLANAEVAIIEERYQRALNEFKNAEELHPDERSKNGIREAERFLKEKHQKKMNSKREEDAKLAQQWINNNGSTMAQQWMEEQAEKKKANEKYLNMTADDRELGTGFYHIFCMI